MNGAVCLTLDVPPSANDYWRVWRNRAVRTALAEAYCSKVLIHARNRGIKPFPINAPVAVTLKWFRAIRAGDLDNRLKIALDSLQGAVLVNEAAPRT